MGNETGALLGEVVTWDLGAMEVSVDAVTTALLNSGLDSDSLGEMSARSAFGRACKYLQDKRQIDKVSTAAGVTKFQLTQRAIEDGKLDFTFETAVYLNNETGDITADVLEIQDQARELFAHARQTRTNADITRLVQRLFRENADLFALSPKGVAYFVPQIHRDFTTKIDTFLRLLGGKLCRFPVPTGTAEGNLSVRDAVQSGLTGLVEELNAAVESWDDTTRESTMKKKVSQWEVLRHKVEAYDTYLGEEQERLQTKLTEARQRLAEKMTASSAA